MTDATWIEFNTYPTSHGVGPFHPALRTGQQLMYWPNVTFDNEDDAFSFATKAFKDMYDAAVAVAQQWNVYPVEG